MKRGLVLLFVLIPSMIEFAGEITANTPPSFTLFTIPDTIHPATLIFSAIDPEGDSIRYIISWDDGYFDTLGFYQSGETVLISHRYSLCGIYIPSAMAIDSKGAATEFYSNVEEAVYGVKLPPLFIAGWTFGGKDDDVGNSVQQTSDGGYIIAGYTKSFSAGSSDVYLIKTDSSGNLLWQKTFGGKDDDVGNSVQQTSDGGYIIAGYTKSFGAGSSDVYLIKTDSSGNLLWQKTFGGEEEDVGNSVQETPDSGFIIVGYTKSFGVIDCDIYVIKTDKNGNLLWQKTFGIEPNDTIEGWNGKIVITDSQVYEISTGKVYERGVVSTLYERQVCAWKEIGNSLAQTLDSGYIIMGTTIGIITAEIFLIKIDSKGNLLWKKIIDSSDWGITGNSIKQTKKGGYIIVGTYGLEEKFGLELSQSKSIYYVEIDSQGKTIKGNRLLVCDSPLLGDPGWYSEGTSVDVTSDSGYIILGNRGPDWFFNTRGIDIHLIKFNKNGQPLWERSFGGGDDDGGNSVCQTKDGGYIIAGYTCSFDASGLDVYLIKTDSSGNPYNHFGPYVLTLFGPDKVYPYVSYDFFASAISPQGESVSIRFSWGDGDTSGWSNYFVSGETIKVSHIWQNPGTYSVKAQARDKKGAISVWSEPFTITIIANHAPNPPATPSGPTTAFKDSLCSFKTVANDPDGDSVAIRFAWGDGDTSDWSPLVASAETVSLSHSWQTGGTYAIRAQAKDKYNAVSNWSGPFEITIIANRAPNPPATPTGPSQGRKDSVYTFSTVTTDPDGDAVCYRFAFGDGDTSDWTNWVQSGTPVTINHSYQNSGTYSVKAQAKDVNEVLSSWSNPHQIVITNFPPDAPRTPSGPSAGFRNTSYNFSVSATDPDGDSVAIRFAWGDGDTSNWSVYVPSGQTVTMNHSWRDSGIYYVKAQAKDKEGSVSSWSSGHQIAIEIPWRLATSSAGWSPRNGHTSVVFNNKIWILGGGYEGGERNDVWYSSDGVNWTRATANAGWSPRKYFTSLVFNNKIWILGGDDDNRINDVWYSSDGVNWTRATANAGWSPRYFPTSVVFDNKIWVLGGEDGSGYRNDVWYSSDGVNWTRATANAGWSPRRHHCAVVFNNKIWVLGGVSGSGVRRNDVWYWP